MSNNKKTTLSGIWYGLQHFIGRQKLFFLRCIFYNFSTWDERNLDKVDNLFYCFGVSSDDMIEWNDKILRNLRLLNICYVSN